LHWEAVADIGDQFGNETDVTVETFEGGIGGIDQGQLLSGNHGSVSMREN